jgi:hypothetical protein
LNYAVARPSLPGTAVNHVGDVGEHYPLFLVEKSHHPENITIVYTKLDTHCRVLPDHEHGFLPTLDFYWLMDETRYKPMAGPLKAGARKRLQFIDTNGSQSNPASFSVRTDDLSVSDHRGSNSQAIDFERVEIYPIFTAKIENHEKSNT